MTRTRMNKLVAMFLAILMTIALGIFVPQMKVNALNMTYTPTNGFRNSKYYSQLCDVNLTSDQRANLVNVAKSQIGYHEGNNFEQYGGGSSGSDNVTEYNYWYYGQKHVKGNDTYPWCAVFVSWCAKQAGLSNIIPSFAGCGTGYNSTLPKAGAKTYLRSTGYTPQSGDIIFFNSGGYSPGHVGIVNYVSNGYVYTIEGNSSDKVNTVSYALSNTKIYGYAVPNYNGSTPPIPQNNDDELGIPYPRPSGNPLLSTGSRGSGISWLQTALNKANNAGLDVDGQFGSGTKQAVINFQKANGLEADGIAGPATVNKLVEVIKNKLNPPAPIVPQGHVMSESEAAGQTIPNGDYLIYSAIDQNYALDIPGDRISESGANIQMWKWTNEVKPTVYDVFTVTYCENGFYLIGQKDTDLFLDVYDASLDRGTNVQLWAINNSVAQQWSITKTDLGYMLQARCNGFCLDVTGGNVENGTNVQVWDKNDTLSQRFLFVPYKPEAPNLRVDVNEEKVTFSWNLVDNATGYDLRIYYSNGTSYADYWDFSSNEHSLTITMPENTEFYAAVCSKNSNYDECWSYGQQVSFKTGIHKHEWGNWTIGKSATCKEAGIEIRNCKKCDENETRSIPAIGHNWSSWSIVKEATCTSEGQEARTCTVCGAKETCSIAKTVHKFTVKVIAPTFTKQGYDLHTCSKCGDFYKDNYTAMKIKGDINSDGEFNISDAVLLQKWILAEPNAKLADWKAADLCEDGKIDVFDLCMMKRMLVAKS